MLRGGDGGSIVAMRLQLVEAIGFMVMIFFKIFNDYYDSRIEAVRLYFMPWFTIKAERSPGFTSVGYVSVLKSKRNGQNNRGQNPFLHWCLGKP